MANNADKLLINESHSARIYVICARNLADEAISIKKIDNGPLMLPYSGILIDNQGINCSEKALTFCKELYSYISALSCN